MSVDALLHRLDGVRSNGPGRWAAKCSAHEDRSASLSVRQTDSGVVLIHCFAGCSAADVIASVGLDFGDLFPPRETADPESHHGLQRPRFDAVAAFHALAHEAKVVAIIAETLPSLDVVRDRLLLANCRINAALAAVGELREAPELRRIRRGGMPG